MKFHLQRGLTTLNTSTKKKKRKITKAKLERWTVDLRKYNKQMKSLGMHNHMMTMDQYIDYNDVVINVDDKNISFDNVQVTIPQYSEEGIWTLDHISASDAVGNSLNLYGARDENGNPIKGAYQNQNGELINLDFKTEFEVINTNPDTTAPEFKNLELSQYIFDVTNEDKTFDLSADLTDDISGFISDSSLSNINLSWSSPSGLHYVHAHMGAYMYEYLDQNPEWQDIIIDVDNNNISFENIEVTIPQYSEEGTWTLSNISASDAIGNHIYIQSCLLYTSPSPRDGLLSRMPSSA